MAKNRALLQTLLEESVNTKNIRKKLRDYVTEQVIMDGRYMSMLTLLEQWASDPNTQQDETASSVLSLFSLTDICEKILLAVSYAMQPSPIQAIVAVLGQELCIEDPFVAADISAELLAVTSESDLFDLLLKPGAHKVKANFTLSNELCNQIEAAQYPMPMLATPRKIEESPENMDTSHFIQRRSLLLGKQNHHNKHLCVDAINIINSIPLSLDIPTIETEEMPNKPLDTLKKQKQFNQLAESSLKVYAEMIAIGNLFYMTHGYDYRGRLYSHGYHINLQSTDYKKASISLYNKEVME